ncbi:MAG TPA: 4-(cytidine 5'-diphospho)-2-C-methyl-D-erythritol kinase [Hyphomicrobiaceae bacterium]|nr:4-(cytidine 5'-diphospho)-2-C-methyl-D-erythritol kinase [Hyphomicrobiaceae bacterium]
MSSEGHARIWESAFAKVNLTLEILGRRSDGYHQLSSLVAFARDVFDLITLAPGPRLHLEQTGPAAGNIDGHNIITTAAAAAAAAFPEIRLGQFTLDKQIPVAAGLGGGSADAAAALRAILRANPEDRRLCDDTSDKSSAAFRELCAGIGADVSVCFGGGGRSAAIMTGLGEIVWRPDAGSLLPPGLHAVLVNPRHPVTTASVFAKLDAPPIGDAIPSSPPGPARFRSLDEVINFLETSRNDLEAPAIAIAPVISTVLEEIRALRNCCLTRMSGSGATCFGLFTCQPDAEQAAASLKLKHPDWWIKPTGLG